MRQVPFGTEETGMVILHRMPYKLTGLGGMPVHVASMCTPDSVSHCKFGKNQEISFGLPQIKYKGEQTKH